MAIPQRVRDELIVEAQHRCTICSEPCYEIHHIMELADGGTDASSNLIVLCPNCHQHRYHRHGEFSRDQLYLYKAKLKESAEIERRLLQNLERIASTLSEKPSQEVLKELKGALDEGSRLIAPNRRPRLAATIVETARGLAEDSILPEAARRAIEFQYEVERQRVKSQYPEVGVAAVDQEAYRKSDAFPRAYEFVLLLNAAPHKDWVAVFNMQYEHSLYSGKRDTSICGGKLVMIVADSDNLQEHIDWVKELIRRTNEIIQMQGFTHIDRTINQQKSKALEEFDAIQSMKDRTRGLKI